MSAPLSDTQGYELVRVGKKFGLPVDMQKLIWADVTGRYHRRHGRWGEFGLSVIEKAHVVKAHTDSSTPDADNPSCALGLGWRSNAEGAAYLSQW